jgi:hypothetical protein
VTIGIAFVAIIVFLGGTSALVTALLAGVGTVAITALLAGIGTVGFTFGRSGLIHEEASEAAGRDRERHPLGLALQGDRHLEKYVRQLVTWSAC